MEKQKQECKSQLQKKDFSKIAIEVEKEWKMGGLSGTIYEDYAWEIYNKICK